jgi:sulfur carrier protein
MAMTSETITLNGNSHEIAPGATIAGVLAQLGLDGKPVVVELDEEAVFPRDYGKTPVRKGSRMEVITLAAGG